MQEDIYTRIHRVLSWKRIMAMNLVLFLVLAVPISVRLAQESQENRSSAAEDDTIITQPTPPPNYPTQPPVIERVQMFYGKAGDTVVVMGKNFGAYPWESSVYVGNAPAGKPDIVRWSDSIIEVNIPQAARTGKVWVTINGSRATWEGSLLMYDLRFAIKTGLAKAGASQINLWVDKGDQIGSGLVELSYTGSPPTVVPLTTIEITESTAQSDSFGQKFLIRFRVNSTLSRTKTDVMQLQLSRPSRVEILRAEFLGGGENLLETYSDPLSVTVQP